MISISDEGPKIRRMSCLVPRMLLCPSPMAAEESMALPWRIAKCRLLEEQEAEDKT